MSATLAPPVEAAIERVTARAFTVPTDRPEQDGTLAWEDTTLVVVRVEADGVAGTGYAYGDRAAADVVASKLAGVVAGQSAMSIASPWWSMRRAVRNAGLPGVCATAISAVDVALWDLKARLLKLSVATLLGRARDRVPVYGSGGFTSYSRDQLVQQLSEWSDHGLGAVKMKIGTDPEHDAERVAAVRSAIDPATELFVDANGAYERKQALLIAEQLAAIGVTWFEEPVSSDDLEGLRLIRDRGPTGMRIAAGEYGHDGWYFRRMLQAGAVDVLQADATRCLGISGFLQAAALADAFGVPISAHTAPALHVHACCAAGRIAPLEWFHDHVRIESMLFEGAPIVVDGAIAPDNSRHGLGLQLLEEEAEQHAA